nr:hypothetical protein [Actinomycetota bacterium]
MFTDLAGQTITITEGTGAGQSRTVVFNLADRVYVDEPWTVVPDASSQYILPLQAFAVKPVNGSRAVWDLGLGDLA